jgi:F0F1-type ATP synthase membrane subunit b/b'
MGSAKPRMSAAERRAAELIASAGKQAQLKREAAERRAERARREAEAPPPPHASTRMRRPRAR